MNAAFTAPKNTPQTNTYKEHSDVIIQLSNKCSATESNRSGSGRNQNVWHYVNLNHSARIPQHTHDTPLAMTTKWHNVLWWMLWCVCHHNLFAGLHAMQSVFNSRLPYPAEWCAISNKCSYCTQISIHAERTEWKRGKQKKRIRRKWGNAMCKKYLQQIFDVAWSTQHRRNKNNWIYRYDRVVNSKFEIVPKRMARFV